jgi:hypothetical protein
MDSLCGQNDLSAAVQRWDDVGKRTDKTLGGLKFLGDAG